MKILSALLRSVPTGQTDKVIETTWREAILYLLAIVFAISTYAACLVGLWFFLVPQYGPMNASFILAAMSLVTGVILVVVARILDKRARVRLRHSEQALMMQSAATIIPQLINARSPMSLLVAGGLGYLAAESLQDQKRKRQ